MAPPTKESVQRSMKRLFKRYIKQCARRNVFWNLTLEQFKEITSNPCTYCGIPPLQITRSYKYNGIDRKNNKKGYEPENVTACCGQCNRIKGCDLSFDDMRAIGKVIAQIRQRRI